MNFLLPILIEVIFPFFVSTYEYIYIYILSIFSFSYFPISPPFLSFFSSFFSSFSRTVATSPDEHLVTSLPGLPDNAFPTKHYAGHVPVTDGFEFYWLFESSDPNPDSRPLVIWLNGGPVRNECGVEEWQVRGECTHDLACRDQ